MGSNSRMIDSTPDTQGDQAKHERGRETRQIANLTGSETELTVRRVPLGIGISDCGHTQSARVRRHMEAIGQERHRSGDIAGEYLADHHDSRQNHNPQSPARILIVGSPQIHVVMRESINVAGRRQYLSLISRSGV
jgi:hypothetical protein